MIEDRLIRLLYFSQQAMGSDLVISEEFLDRIGPAVNTASSKV